ncbi:MAG: hypothetical protein ABIL58_24175 [Pseudomonadota bacterium]
MTDRDDGKKDKRSYETPVLRIIELAAEEVLAVGCKTQAVGTAGFGNGKAVCTFPRQCYGAGS